MRVVAPLLALLLMPCAAIAQTYQPAPGVLTTTACSPAVLPPYCAIDGKVYQNMGTCDQTLPAEAFKCGQQETAQACQVRCTTQFNQALQEQQKPKPVTAQPLANNGLPTMGSMLRDAATPPPVTMAVPMAAAPTAAPAVMPTTVPATGSVPVAPAVPTLPTAPTLPGAPVAKAAPSSKPALATAPVLATDPNAVLDRNDPAAFRAHAPQN